MGHFPWVTIGRGDQQHCLGYKRDGGQITWPGLQNQQNLILSRATPGTSTSIWIIAHLIKNLTLPAHRAEFYA